MAGRVNLPLLYLAVMVVSSVLIASITHYVERVGSWSPVAVCLLWSLPIWAVGIAWGYRSDRRQGDIIYVYLLALAYWLVGGLILGDLYSVSHVEMVQFFSVATPAVCGISAAAAQYWFVRRKHPDAHQPRSNRSNLLRLAIGISLFIVLRESTLVAIAGIAYQYGLEGENGSWYTPLLFPAIWLSLSCLAAGLLGVSSAYPLERTTLLSAAVSFTTDIGWTVNIGMPALAGSLALFLALAGSYPLGVYLRLRRGR